MRRLLSIGIICLLTLAACGGPAKASTTINVTMVEFSFTPDTFTVPAGQQITLTAHNNGAKMHEFIIFKLGTDPGAHFGPEDEPNVYWQISVEPGTTQTGTFTAPSDPGEYYVTCGVAGHHEAGMNAKLIVVAQ